MDLLKVGFSRILLNLVFALVFWLLDGFVVCVFEFGCFVYFGGFEFGSDG